MNSGPQASHDLVRLFLTALAGALGLAGAGLLSYAALHGLDQLVPAPWAAAVLGGVLLILSAAVIALLDIRAGTILVSKEPTAPLRPTELAAFFLAFLLSRRLSRRG